MGKEQQLKEAYLYERRDDKKVQCNLCRHRCLIEKGKLGFCQVRKNEGGTLYSLVYGYAIARNVDPIEKKPLFHFQPGKLAFSIATVGCNFRCPYCQNYSISQMVKDRGQIAGEWCPPERVVELAVRHNCSSISYTYTEPTIYFEYAYDTAKLAKEKGLRNNFVTNGYMTEEAIEMIEPYLDGANVDLKNFSAEVYRTMMRAKLEGVLSSIKALREAGIWVEITTLVVPEVNDSEEQLRGIAEFIASVGAEVPWHVTRFHPDYEYLDSYPTPVETLQRARQLGLEAGLRYVYTGNLPGDEGESTFCYNCKTMLIQRMGFGVLRNCIKEGHCPECGVVIDGVDM